MNANAPCQFPGISPWRQTVWDMRAAGNFIGGGTGTGLVIAGALMGAPGLIVAGLVFVALGLGSVFLEIGRPLRAANVLLHPRRSWMTREAYVAALLFPLGAASLPWPELAPLVALPAVIYLYCQARILLAAKGIPAWRHPLVGPLIVTSGLAEGLGLAAVAAGLLDKVPEWLGAALFAALALRLVVWIAYRHRLAAGHAPIEALRALLGISLPFQLGGNVLPALLVVVATLMPELALPSLAAAGLASALAGWAMKSVLITRAAFNQGFAIPVSPTRGAGRAGPGIKPGW